MSEQYKQKNREFVERLSKLNAGDLAQLRRATDDPSHNVRIMPALARIGALEDNIRAMISSLYAVCHREGDSPYYSDEYNFGKSYFQSLRGDKKDFKPEDHDTRFKTLISSDRDELPFRLRQIVKQTNSKGEKIDFSTLIGELYNWEHESRWVQRKWVSGFYGIGNKDNNDNTKGE